MNLRKIIRGLIEPLRRWHRDHSSNARSSYSQSGEDLIISQLFLQLKIQRIRYLDIGAHHPTYLSNTYYFYREGGDGVCVEPDPTLCANFPKIRPRDYILNCGVGIVEDFADFFVLSTPTLNTFSEKEAYEYVNLGSHSIVKKLKIEIQNVNNIIKKNFSSCPNLVSLDIEGWDLIVLSSFDFVCYRPEVFCIETLSYKEDNSERKLTEIIEFMHQNNYMTYADTYINTIFVDRACWESRPL
jgi:FkbM family methyltransferase